LIKSSWPNCAILSSLGELWIQEGDEMAMLHDGPESLITVSCCGEQSSCKLPAVMSSAGEMTKSMIAGGFIQRLAAPGWALQLSTVGLVAGCNWPLLPLWRLWRHCAWFGLVREHIKSKRGGWKGYSTQPLVVKRIPPNRLWWKGHRFGTAPSPLWTKVFQGRFVPS
jgi:hypothetical protein